MDLPDRYFALYSILISVALFWFLLLFCDTIFKSCMFHPYFKLLQMSGLQIKPLLIHWRITSYNRFINQMGRWRSELLKRWFDVGAVVTCAIVVPCIFIYLISLLQMFRSTSAEDNDSTLLVPIIPGYNFPLAHSFYYLTVILLCSVIHEFGHALAASRERIGIDDWGFAIFAVFPLAFVNVRFDQFREISLWQQLRILCAGIWHNIVLSVLALLLLSAKFFIFSPFFRAGNGVTVHQIHQLSALNHPAGLEIGDHIYGIGDCIVRSRESWESCLKQLTGNPPKGFCVPRELKFDNIYSKKKEACINSSEYLSFKAAEQNSEKLCLQARHIAESYDLCDHSPDCESSSVCLFPVLQYGNDRFVAIKRFHKPLVLYEGSVIQLFEYIQMSNFVPKFKLLPSSIPESIITVLEYILMFSCGLAVINMLPVFSMDGQYIIENLIHLCFEGYIPRFDQRRYIFTVISKIFTVLFICMILVISYKFYMYS